MKEINIAKTLVKKRREKGITQDELAAYMGVSKASVSKWETGQSYPDIVFLPQLAAYFNITLDELMGYSPQLTKEDIKKIYHRLAAAFAVKPYSEVLGECHKTIKKYFSCFPLLLQMAVLLINHHMLAQERKKQEEILQEAVELCRRIKNESGDVWLSKDATSIEALGYLMLQQPQEVLDLLGESIRPSASDDGSIAQAYQMMGNTQKAKEVTQISMYQNLLALVQTSLSYVMMNVDNMEKCDEILKRAFSVAEIYQITQLHPSTMLLLYLASAQVYCMHGRNEEALDMIWKYTELGTTDFLPYSLHGDPYFDLIDAWFEDFDLGTDAVRSEKVIKESMLQGIQANPAFAALVDMPRYKSCIEKLQANIGGK